MTRRIPIRSLIAAGLASAELVIGAPP